MATRKPKATKKARKPKGAASRKPTISGAPTRARVKEAAWWNERRETAFGLLVAGAAVMHVAQSVGVDESTLYDWRSSPMWQRRLVELRDARESRFAEAMLGIDEAAVMSMKTHVMSDPSAALEWLHRRGILPKPSDTPALSAEFEKQLGEMREGVTGDQIAAAIRAVARYAASET